MTPKAKYLPLTEEDAQLLGAAARGDLPTLQFLLNRGADVNCRSTQGWTPLLEASDANLTAARLLLLHGADPNLVSDRGYSPLMRAAGHGQSDLVRVLIEAGADLELRDELGQAALDMAVAGSYTGTAMILGQALRKLVVSKGEPNSNPKAYARPSPSRTQSIFIASTFRDMQSERDLFRDVIFPQLEERLSDRRVQIELIDLRWGVNASSADEQQRWREILKVCVGEIQRSRPIFIALLGDRYGWVPPVDSLIEAAREAGIREDASGWSVTELEIRCALNDRRIRDNCLICVREPFDYRHLVETGQMASKTAAEFSEDHRRDAGALTARYRLQDLKESVRPYTLGYSGRWNAERQRVDGLEDWCNQVGEHLWTVLESETRELVRQVPSDWKSTERELFWEFIRDEAQVLDSRSTSLERLLEHVHSSDHERWGICIVADQGHGKSTLLAALCEELRKSNVVLLPHFAGRTVRAQVVGDILRIWTDTLAQYLELEQPALEGAGLKQVGHTFWSLIRQVALSRRIVLVLDELESVHARSEGELLSWLAPHWPRNVRLVISSLGPTAALLERTRGLQRVELGPLQPPAQRRLIESICRRYHRILPPESRRVLLKKRTLAKERAAGNPRWLRLAVEALNLIDQDDFAKAEHDISAASPEDRIRRLLRSVVEELPPTLEGIYRWLLERADRLHDAHKCRVFLGLLSISRIGLRERDLRVLIPKMLGQEWDDTRFATIRRTFRALVGQRSDAWIILDAGFRRAVLGRLGAGGALSFHQALAEHLLELSKADPLRESETTYHLIHAGDRRRLVRHLANLFELMQTAVKAHLSHLHTEDSLDTPDHLLVFQENLAPDLDQTIERMESERIAEPFRRANEALAEEVLRRENGVAWALSLLDEADVEERRTLCEWFQRPLTKVLTDRADIDSLSALAEGLRLVREQSIERTATMEDERWAIDSYLRAGDLKRWAGEYLSALESYRNGERRAKERWESSPQDSILLHDLVIIRSKIGITLHGLGDLSGAAQTLEETLKVARELRLLDDSAPVRVDVAETCIEAGSVYRALRRFDEAKIFLKEARDLMQRPVIGVSREVRDSLLATALEALGGIENDTGNRNVAIALLQQAVDLRSQLLSQNATSTLHQDILARVLLLLADASFENGDTKQAAASFDRASLLLPDEDQDNRKLGNRMHRGRALIGMLKCSSLPRGSEFRLATEKAILEIERVQADFPSNRDTLHYIYNSQIEIGCLFETRMDFDYARKAYARAIQAATAYQTPGSSDATALRDLAAGHMRYGNCCVHEGAWAEAQPHFEQSLELIGAALLAYPKDRNLLRDLIGATWMLGCSYLETGELELADSFLHRCRRSLNEFRDSGFDLDPQLRDIDMALQEK